MNKKILVTVGMCVLLVAVIAGVLRSRTTGAGVTGGSNARRDFDWAAIKEMIDSGALKNEHYSLEKVKLDRVPMPGMQVYFVVDTPHEELLGPKQALVLYYPEAKILDHDPEQLKTMLESRQYTADSPDELLKLVSEVAPLLYGSRPEQHEIVTNSDLPGSGQFPITKDTLLIHERPGLFVNYYAKIGPWGDLVNVSAVLDKQQLRVSLHPIHLVSRAYE